MKYSLKKGLYKGLISALTIAIAMTIFAGVSDITVTELIEKYVFPFLGSVTVGGALTMLLNYIKIRNS